MVYGSRLGRPPHQAIKWTDTVGTALAARSGHLGPTNGWRRPSVHVALAGVPGACEKPGPQKNAPLAQLRSGDRENSANRSQRRLKKPGASRSVPSNPWTNRSEERRV